MAETYCGKTCAECVHKEELNCPGCKAGPGANISGDCDLARCCRTKGHETCDTCNFHGNCGTLQLRESVPDQRRRKLILAEQEKEALAKRAPVLGKWMWILFWLFIPAEIAGFMSHEMISQYIPFLGVIGQIMGAAINVTYCLILLKLSSEETRYRYAGICSLVGWGLNLLASMLSGGEGGGWTLLLTVPAAVIALVGDYQEFTAHENVLWGVDNELSDKWGKLWKWYIGSFGAMLASVLLALFAQWLAVILLITAAIAILVIYIVKLVYLYCTAKVFRTYEPAK